MMQLAENVGNRVSASLEMALSRAMMPLTQSLDTFIKCATREQVDGVRRIVGQFVQQLNTTLGDQLHDLGSVVSSVTEDQRETQRNLHNTMAAAQSMSKDAESIRQSAASIAEQMKLLGEEMQAEHERKSEKAGEAEAAGLHLAARIENLSDSLRRMQLAVDVLTAELNGTQPAEAEDER